MDNNNLNEELMEAVTYFKTDKVKECLERGADPNYCRFRDEDGPNGLIQPTTPLRMVLFRISDCDLNDDNLKEYVKITKMLLDSGANSGPAIEISESRYGEYKPEEYDGHPFMEVIKLVNEANTSRKIT